MTKRISDSKSEDVKTPPKRFDPWARFLQKMLFLKFWREDVGDFFISKWFSLYYGAELFIRRRRFDASWYLEQNPDVAASGMDPFQHYVQYGRAEGRPPGPEAAGSVSKDQAVFNAAWYLEQNPDVAESGMDPYRHYMRYGKAEGRQPGPGSADEEDLVSEGKDTHAEEESSLPPLGDMDSWEELRPLDIRPEAKRVAVVVHYYYPELWPQIEARLAALQEDFDLFITAPSSRTASAVAHVTKTFPQARFYFGPDRGMDIIPFLSLIPTLINEKYVAVCKLHTKRGDRAVPGAWRNIMLGTLVGSNANFSQAVRAFIDDPDVCMIGPACLFQSGPRLMYGNRRNLLKILKGTYDRPLPVSDWGFFAGTMFWTRPEALEVFSRFVNHSFFRHDPEYKTDGKLEHALERFFGLIPVYRSGKVGLLHPKSLDLSDSCLILSDPSSVAGKASVTNVLRQFVRLEQDERIIRESGLFDEKYYIRQYGDQVHPEMNLIAHYLLQGVHAGLRPNRFFSPDEYRALECRAMHNIQTGGQVEPFVDYLTRGASQRLHFRRDPKVEREVAPHYPHVVLNATLVDWKKMATMPRDKRKVSIVIPVFGQMEFTKTCIHSILSAKVNALFEVLLVDNGSEGNDRAALREIARGDGRIKLVTNDENYNFALGCNIGFSKSDGEVVVFLNNDTVVTAGWLDKLVAPLGNKRVAAVQPRLLFPDGTVQNVGIVFSKWSPLPYPIYSGVENDMPCLEQSRSFRAVTAACIAVRSQDFAALRGFDPAFVNGHEDIDLCLRLTEGTGRVCWYEAGAVVYHHEGKTPGRGQHIVHNRREFISRWAEKIEPDDLNYYQEDGFDVTGWTVDSPEYLQEGIAIFKPVLTPRDRNDDGEILSCAQPFKVWDPAIGGSDFPPRDSYVPGKVPRKAGRISVLVCAHATGKELFGGERSFLDVLDALALLDLDVIVTLPDTNNSPYLEAVRKLVSGIYIFNYEWWFRGTSPSKVSVARFQSIIEFHRVRVVHVNTLMLREPLIAARISGAAGIVHAREVITRDPTLALYIGLKPEEIVERVLATSDCVIANSDKTAEVFGDKSGTFVVPNVVRTDDLDIPNRVDPQAIVFGLVGNNIKKKGILDLVEVARLCEKTVPQALFAFVGPETVDMRTLKEAQAAGKLPGNIRFLGYKDTPLAAMSEVNVVLNLSSFAESFGRSAAEAMAARRPVIAYAWGALPEIVKDEVSGYLVPYRDIGAVAARVERLCRNPELIQILGKAGREYIQNYSVERLSRSLDPIYAEVMVRKQLEKQYSSIHADSMEIFRAARSRYPVSLRAIIAPVTIIVTAYNAVRELLSCIQSIVEHTELAFTKLLIMDDASSDPRVEKELAGYEGHPSIRIVRNKTNLGYTKSINKAVALAGGEDVVLLNSDTVVTPNWLLGLRLSAYAMEKAGTVTAMSDNAGAFSFPVPGQENSKPPEISYHDYARAMVRGCLDVPLVELPTGNGFCMYIRRRLLDDIGLFDEVSFPRGYGEENDFCMRALKRGFVNLLSPWAFVFHSRGASFKEEKTELLGSAMLTLKKLHPDYDDLVAAAFASPPFLKLVSLSNKAMDGIKASRLETPVIA